VIYVDVLVFRNSVPFHKYGVNTSVNVFVNIFSFVHQTLYGQIQIVHVYQHADKKLV